MTHKTVCYQCSQKLFKQFIILCYNLNCLKNINVTFINHPSMRILINIYWTKNDFITGHIVKN